MQEYNETTRLLKDIVVSLQELTDVVEKLQETAMGTFVQMSRLYDVNAARAAGLTPTEIVALLDLHEVGTIFSSPPVLKRFVSENGEDDATDQDLR